MSSKELRTGRIFCDDLLLPEGPVVLDDGTLLVTELGLERGCITLIAADGATKRVVAKTGRPNGLAVDHEGTIWVAESLEPSILRLGLDGESVVHATACEGEPLLWPNDICVGPDGAIYVTDSGTPVKGFLDGNSPPSDLHERPFDGRVCRFDRSGGAGAFVDRNLRFANGIAFGPDGLLYASETLTGNIYRYEPAAENPVRHVFANVLDPDHRGTGLRGPDGMKFDEAGYLYVTVFGQGDVTVVDPTGGVVGRIALAGNAPTNLAFGLPGSREIFVTEDEHGRTEVHPVPRDGLALHR